MGSSLILLTIVLVKMLVRKKRILKSILAFMFISYILKFIGYGYLYIVPGLITGMAGHLFLDLFTIKGVPLFYPIKKNISLRKEPFGSPVEFLITIVYCLMYVETLYIWNYTGAL